MRRFPHIRTKEYNFNVTTNTALALRCLEVIRSGRSCALGAGRNAAMAGQQSCGGKSILDMLWDELLKEYGALIGLVSDNLADEESRALSRGQCLGLGTAIAILVNPYSPNIDAVRAECVERWENM